MLRRASGCAISARYLRTNAAHCAGVAAESPSFIVARLGARFGYHASYQSRAANCDFGTPRGGRRTVPMRRPSDLARGVPRLTTRATMIQLLGRSGYGSGLTRTQRVSRIGAIAFTRACSE